MGLEEYFMLLSFMIWIQRGSLGDEPRSDSERRDSENYSYRSMRDTNGAALELSLFHSEKQSNFYFKHLKHFPIKFKTSRSFLHVNYSKYCFHFEKLSSIKSENEIMNYEVAS